MKKSMTACAVLLATCLGACATAPAGGGGGGSPPPPTPAGQSFAPDDCAGTLGSPKDVDGCSGNGCFFWVDVIYDPVAMTCKVVVGTRTMRVRGAQNEKVQLRWLLAPGTEAKWEFRAEPPSPPPPFARPITFKPDNPPNLPYTFSNLNVSPAQVTLDDTLNAKGPFNYGVRVYFKRTGTPLDSPDPAIMNDW